MPATSDRVDTILGEWRRERPDLDPSPIGVIGRLHRLADVLDRALARVFAQFDITRGEFDVLATLRRAGAPFERTAGSLADHTMISGGGLTKRVDRLAARGLVERFVDPDDSRVRHVRLSPTGLALFDEALAAHLANEARLVAALGTDPEQFAATLRDWLHGLGED